VQTRTPRPSWPSPARGIVLARGALALLALACTAAATAATHPCAAIAAPEQRLACFDAAFPSAPASSASASAPAASTVATPAGDDDAARRDFGLNERQRHALDPQPVRDSGPERIEATVATLQYAAGGERVFTLDNGQVWQQTEASSRGRVSPGDRIHVRRASLGTFMLVTPARVGLRVRRLR
jgi:hypothetical protein